jgi:ornithine cyclodeaminase/alanine dehydrogenase-like protein (mu-crystallin family)
MLRDADVVITLTESRTPLVFPGMLKPGAVVCSMGSYNEVEYGVLLEGQRLVVDDSNFASEMGDGAAWIGQGHLTRAQFVGRIDALVCEVMSGRKAGRLAPSDRIVALIQGMAIGDVAFAAHALREAEKTGRGTIAPLL